MGTLSTSHIHYMALQFTSGVAVLQGCWGDESSLMMLPNVTPDTVTSLEQKGFRGTSQLCQAASQDPAGLKSTLTSVLGGSREASEVMQASLCNIATKFVLLQSSLVLPQT